jgi:hypothetical protein
MKCISAKVLDKHGVQTNGIITRVSDKIAEAKVKSGEAVYRSKVDWKVQEGKFDPETGKAFEQVSKTKNKKKKGNK